MTADRKPTPVSFGEGNAHRCRRCDLLTNPTIPESEWDGLCGLCRAGRDSTYPAATIRMIGDWQARMRRLLPFDGGRRLLEGTGR